MSVTDAIADVLDTAAKPAGGLLGALVKGPARAIVEPAVEQALGLAADLVRAGDDAAVVIERIRRSPELLEQARTEARWAAKLDAKFPVPDPRDTQPTGPPELEPYEED